MSDGQTTEYVRLTDAITTALRVHADYKMCDPSPTEYWLECSCGERFDALPETGGARTGHHVHIAASIAAALRVAP